MREATTSFLSIVFLIVITQGYCWAKSCRVSIVGLQSDPKVAFAVGDLKEVLNRADCEIADIESDLQIIFDTYEPGMGPQSFRILKQGVTTIRVIGGDALGAMYGGLELAEMISLGGVSAIKEKARKPYIFRRGIKFNIPLDARAPSYDDTGTSAHVNISTMWEWDFWRDYLDGLARNRYNVLTLWTTHPYPGWVKLPRYPYIGYDDVCINKTPPTMKSNRHYDDMDVYDPNAFQVVKEISLDDKIAFWQRVFQHAEDRGIEVYIFHWNIYSFGARGRHGIDDRPDNPNTINYMRYCIGEFLKTYPQVDGVGVTAGEHVDRERVKKVGGIEEWLWRTYGQGVMDAKRAMPDKDYRFIFRQHQANLGRICRAFRNFDGAFNTGHKYARARLYSTTTSPYLDNEYRQQLEEYKVPCWLNLRNDDIFIYRWGDPDYVREFLQNVPRDMMRYEAGFYMGPDGFVFGREFVSKNPDLTSQLELNKHWYRFMLWGRLGYDLSLTRDYFEQRLDQRYHRISSARLYDTWQAASQIIPEVNKFFFRVNDHMFSPEACNDSHGFLSLNQFFKHPPLRGSGILSVKQYATAVNKNQAFPGMTPLEVADRIDALAKQTLKGVRGMRKFPAKGQTELLATLVDMEAMAYLGRYYADKIRGAAELAVYRDNRLQVAYHEKAVTHLNDAVSEWEAYTKVATDHYLPQLFSRTHYMNWEALLESVKLEAEMVQKEKD